MSDFGIASRQRAWVPLVQRLVPSLHDEIVAQIVEYVIGSSWTPSQISTEEMCAKIHRTHGPHPALQPPANGYCGFMKLPVEIRGQILAEELLSQDTTIRPTCVDSEDGLSTKPRIKTADGKTKPIPNRMSDLMMINEQIKAEIADIIYEHRTFEIHVHEGIRDGGIEFINTGRQPLQYQHETNDQRFWKFTDGEHDFGFKRLKKIKVIIFPDNIRTEDRHTATNTYLMNLALCRLLDRAIGGEARKNRITNIEISFADAVAGRAHAQSGRRAIVGVENYWWDLDRSQPRITSIHNLANVELVLRPYSTLTGCHRAKVILPYRVRDHAESIRFASKLEHSMMSMMVIGFDIDDELEHKIEVSRAALEEYIMHSLYGSKDHFDVAEITDEELWEDFPEAYEEAVEMGTKHEMSSKSSMEGGFGKKQKMMGDEDAGGHGMTTRAKSYDRSQHGEYSWEAQASSGRTLADAGEAVRPEIQRSQSTPAGSVDTSDLQTQGLPSSASLLGNLHLERQARRQQTRSTAGT